MKRLDVFMAFQSLALPSTKEDIVIEIAKQKNIRFNELPMLQKEVDRALDESIRLGFVDLQSNYYKLNVPTPRKSKSPALLASQRVSPRQMKGQGDGKPECCASYPHDTNSARSSRPRSSHNVKKEMHSEDISFCCECGQGSDTTQNIDKQDDTGLWSLIKDMEDCE